MDRDLILQAQAGDRRAFAALALADYRATGTIGFPSVLIWFSGAWGPLVGVDCGLNLLALLFIALLPFSTSLMVSNLSGPNAGVAVIIYGINVLVASVMLTLLMAYLVRQRALLLDEIADETLASLTRQRWVSNGVCLIAVACALVAHDGGGRPLRPGYRPDVGTSVPPGAPTVRPTA